MLPLDSVEQAAPSAEGEKEWFKELLLTRERGSHRHVAFGWVSSPVLNRYAKRLGVQFEPKAKRDAERRVVPCFKCGVGVLRFEWYERNSDAEPSWSFEHPDLGQGVSRGRAPWLSPSMSGTRRR